MVTSSCPVVIPNLEVRTLSSKSVGQEYRILIALPKNYAESNDKYPVLYVTDSGFIFGWVTDLVRAAAFLRAVGFHSTDYLFHVPNLIVAGISYPTTVEPWYILQRWKLGWSLRNRDLTPTKISDKFWGASGGAEKFLRFIREELMPYVNSNYRTDPEDSTVVGHSFGGLFALYVLFHEPETFRRYVASSPSLWWDQKVTFEYERKYAAKHTELPAKLFLSVGSREGDMVSNLKEFVKILKQRKYIGLEWKSHIFEDEGHISVLGTAICRGISSVFSK